jgi:hypothetical protein
MSAVRLAAARLAAMANDLRDRIHDEIRERKDASRAAYEECQRLQRALAALDEQCGPGGSPDCRRRGVVAARALAKPTPRDGCGRAQGPPKVARRSYVDR